MRSASHDISWGLALSALICVAVFNGPAQAQRARAGGAQTRTTAGAQHRTSRAHHTQTARTTPAGTRTTTAHRNVSNTNVTVNRNVNVDAHGYGYRPHPVARGAVAGATAAAVMGSYYRTLPAGCATVTNAGVVYHHCGSTWYQTVHSGGVLQYQVVTAPY